MRTEGGINEDKRWLGDAGKGSMGVRRKNTNDGGNRWRDEQVLSPAEAMKMTAKHCVS